MTYPKVQLKRLNNYINLHSLLPIESVEYINKHVKMRLHFPIFNKLKDRDQINVDTIKGIFKKIIGRNSDLYKNAMQEADDKFAKNDSRFLSYVATKKSLSSIGFEKKLSKNIFIYITDVIEYIVREVFQIAEFYIPATKKRKVVTIESIRLAISNDDELRKVFKIYK